MKRQDLINAIIDLPKEAFSDEEKLHFIRNLPVKFLKIPKDMKEHIGDYMCYAFDSLDTKIPSGEWNTLRLALETQERKKQGWGM